MLASSPNKLRRPRRVSVLDANVGAHLRHLRQQHFGRWQGSLDVPARSIVLCIGLPTERDELLNELFILALREADVDARSTSGDDPPERPDTDRTDLVATVFVAYPLEEMLGQWLEMVAEWRIRLPDSLFVSIRLLSEGKDAKQSVVAQSVDMVLRTFEEGLEFVAPDRPA